VSRGDVRSRCGPVTPAQGRRLRLPGGASATRLYGHDGRDRWPRSTGRYGRGVDPRKVQRRGGGGAGRARLLKRKANKRTWEKRNARRSSDLLTPRRATGDEASDRNLSLVPPRRKRRRVRLDA